MAPRSSILRSYAIKIKEICPELPSVETLVRKLRSPSTGCGDHYLTFPITCTTVAGSDATKVCPIFQELPLWNELLAFLNMELTEIAPGSLNVVRLPETNTANYKRQEIQRAAVCLHWLLVEHKCVEAIEPGGLLLKNYPELFIDALARSGSVRSVRLSRHDLNVEMAIDLMTRTSRKIQLEELQLDNLEFLGDRRKLQACLVLWIRNLASLKSLKLTNMHGPWDADLFAYALQFHAAISKLMVDTHLVEGEKRVFSAFLASTTVLTELVLVGRGLQANREADSLLEALGRNSVLRKVSFHCYSFDLLEATQLSDALAANTALEEVTFLCCYWEFFTHRIPQEKFRRARLENAKCRWGLWWRVDPFVHAIRNSTSLRKLHFDTNHFLDAELTRLLEAVRDSNSFQELCFDQMVQPSVGELWSLIQDSGASGKVTITNCSSESAFFVDCLDIFQSWTSIKKHTFYDLSSAHMLNICTALTCHDSISALHLILDESGNGVSEQCAFSLAVYMSSTASLKEVYLHFRATDDAVPIIADGLSKNKSLERLSIKGWDFRRDDALTICDWLLQSRTLYEMKWVGVFGRQTASDLIWKLSENLHKCYTLTCLRMDYVCPTDTLWQQVKNFLRRNSCLVERAAHFVLGARTKICSTAFELVSWHPLIPQRVEQLAFLGKQEALERVTEAEQALQRDFWRLSGVVKEEITCEKLHDGVLQIDQLGMDAWLTVRKFIKVSDVVDAKDNPKQTRRRKASIC